MRHGIYIQEMQSEILTPIQTENIIVAVGTAKNPQSKPQLCYTFSEYEKIFGYSGDFEKYTLDEVAKTAFSLYGIAPVVFINVLNFENHFKEILKEFEGVESFKLEGDVIKDSIHIMTGEFVVPYKLTSADFQVNERQETSIDETSGEEITKTIKTLVINATEKIVDNKIDLTYRLLNSDEEVTEEIELQNNSCVLPENIDVNTIEIESGGVDTLTDLDFEVAQDSDGNYLVTVTEPDEILDDKFEVSYKEIDTGEVTAADIIGGVDAATGESTGLELVDAVPATFGISSTFTIIAPGFSENSEVAAAMIAKAKGVAGVYPSMAIADIDAKTYTEAIQIKNNSNLNSPFLIATFPKVTLNGTTYHLSSHLAALMNQVDADNDNIPYVSPSNKALQIDGAVNGEGTAIYLNQGQANLLNENGIATAFSFGGSLKAWGNRTAATSNDPKDVWIPIRRMFNYITAALIRNYLSNLDNPITRRQIDSILQSCNLWLASLVSRQALLGAELVFNSEENQVTDLLAGKITFNLRMAPPTPAENIEFKLTFDSSYYETLFE